MDKSGRIFSCDTASLLDLKAELYRKQEACKLAKARTDTGPRKPLIIKGRSIASKEKEKERGVHETSKAADSNEDEMLQKSRRILEAKAKIYDQIMQKKIAIDEEFSDNYLVDFQRKELFECSMEHKEPDLKSNHGSIKRDSKEDDILGEDLSTGNNLESCISKSFDSLGGESQNSSFNNTSEEKTEIKNHQSDGPIHYQNVQFNEIRDHGVGYFGFSEKEEERQEQMDLLKRLRQDTIENKQAKKKLKQKKQELLQSRLAKVCQRRNIDSSVLQAYSKKEEDDEVPEMVEPEQISSSPVDNSVGTETDSTAKAASKKVRPWDIGKSESDFCVQTPKRKSGAEKWIDHKREERNEEFAPPAFYFDNPEPQKKKFYQGN